MMTVQCDCRVKDECPCPNLTSVRNHLMRLNPRSEALGASTRARHWSWYAALVLAAISCGRPGAARADLVYPKGTPSLGSHYDKTGESIIFRVYSSRA